MPGRGRIGPRRVRNRCNSVLSRPRETPYTATLYSDRDPHFDTASRGAILGLTLNTTRAEIVSAVLSGVTYEMKLNLEMLQSAGVRIARLRAIGGGAKSAVWTQRKADILGVPVAVLETTEAASLGVALLAGQAAGLVADLKAVLARAVRFAYVCDPDPGRAREYAERYDVYRDVYNLLKDVNHRLAALDR